MVSRCRALRQELLCAASLVDDIESTCVQPVYVDAEAGWVDVGKRDLCRPVVGTPLPLWLQGVLEEI